MLILLPVPWDQWLYIPSEGCGVNYLGENTFKIHVHLLIFFRVELSSLLGEKGSLWHGGTWTSTL